ncbi:MAG TPA: MTH938/NDUFAF3 family protein, partial [bacterium]|nr:MTH938/NDUFAF3 family protein [bacterium]
MSHIDSYRFKRIEIDGTIYTNVVIIHPQTLVDNWWRESGHSLIPADLNKYLPNLPSELILGTGKYGRVKVPESTRHWLRDQGAEVIAARTDRACQFDNSSEKG